MNKSDVKLIIVIILIIIIIYLFMNLKKENGKIATVYYDNNIALTIDLTKKQKQEFDVLGYNGNVHIVANYGKVKVEEEKSPKNLCSKQGFISSSNQSIVCLPNKIVIKINSSKYDTILR